MKALDTFMFFLSLFSLCTMIAFGYPLVFMTLSFAGVLVFGFEMVRYINGYETNE